MQEKSRKICEIVYLHAFTLRKRISPLQNKAKRLLALTCYLSHLFLHKETTI
jgi:hypothetical protein